jgi:hypothetical protein
MNSCPEVANAKAEAQYPDIQPKYEKLATAVEYILQGGQPIREILT